MNCPRELIIKLFDDKIEVLEHDLERAVKAGMPSSILYDELDELEVLKDEIIEIFECNCKKECEGGKYMTVKEKLKDIYIEIGWDIVLRDDLTNNQKVRILNNIIKYDIPSIEMLDKAGCI